MYQSNLNLNVNINGLFYKEYIQLTYWSAISLGGRGSLSEGDNVYHISAWQWVQGVLMSLVDFDNFDINCDSSLLPVFSDIH
jgi:hypothetical protein